MEVEVEGGGGALPLTLGEDQVGGVHLGGSLTSPHSRGTEVGCRRGWWKHWTWIPDIRCPRGQRQILHHPTAKDCWANHQWCSTHCRASLWRATFTLVSPPLLYCPQVWLLATNKLSLSCRTNCNLAGLWVVENPRSSHGSFDSSHHHQHSLGLCFASSSRREKGEEFPRLGGKTSC